MDATTMPETFSSFLTDDVLYHAISTHLPWPPSLRKPVSTHRPNRDVLRKHCYPVLTKLIPLPQSIVVDGCLSVLPEPCSPEFPALALGLIQLLDQCPRMLLTGPEILHAFTHFDAIALAVWKRLFENIPAYRRPDAWEAWTAAGYRYEYWIAARVWFLGPLVHSESEDDHDVMERETIDIRAEMEWSHAITDPYKEERRKEPAGDLTRFYRMSKEGPPRGDNVTLPTYVFWCLDMFDAHTPIVRRFGRYPFRNRGMQRESTKDEIKFLQDTLGHGEDVVAGERKRTE